MHSYEKLAAHSAAKAALLQLLVIAAEEGLFCSAVSVCIWVEDGDAIGEYQIGGIDPKGDLRPMTGGSL